MKFEWDNEKWLEGEPPKRSTFLDIVRNEPKAFFFLSIGMFVLFAMYGGKIIMWVIRHVIG